MLSKMQMLVLGTIKEVSINPYEILKLFNSMEIEKWFSYGTSSVYAAIKVLEKKAYIQGQTERLGNNPEKCIYSISSEGESKFIENLRLYILNTSGDYQALSLAFLFLCHLTREEANSLLIKRELFQIKEKNIISRSIRDAKESEDAPPILRLTMEHRLLACLADLEALKRVRREVKNAESWDVFLFGSPLNQ